MEKDNQIDKAIERQRPLESMSAPYFLEVKRQSLQCRCFCGSVLWCCHVCAHGGVHVCVPGRCCCGETVARTNHYLVVAGLERSAVWNVRLCSTGARCSMRCSSVQLKRAERGSRGASVCEQQRVVLKTTLTKTKSWSRPGCHETKTNARLIGTGVWQGSKRLEVSSKVQTLEVQAHNSHWACVKDGKKRLLVTRKEKRREMSGVLGCN